MAGKDETLIDSLNAVLAKSKDINAADLLTFNQDFMDSGLPEFAAASKNSSIIEQLNPLLGGKQIGPGVLKPHLFKGGVPGLQYKIKLN